MITVLEPSAFVVVSTLKTVDKEAVEVTLPLPELISEVVICALVAVVFDIGGLDVVVLSLGKVRMKTVVLLLPMSLDCVELFPTEPG